MMDKNLVHILINNNKINSTCFFCLKTCELSLSIYDVFEIRDEEPRNVSIYSIIKSLFPSFEIILRKCCKECSSCLVTIFKILQQNQKFQEIINSAHEKLTWDIKKIDLENIQNKKIILKLNKNVTTCQETDIIDYKTEKSMASNFECKNCTMKFDSTDKLQMHCKGSHYLNKNNANICDICGKIFKTYLSLKSHLNSHKNKQCPYCLKSLKNNSHYRIHLRRHKNGTNKVKHRTVYRCNDCTYKSFNKGSLAAHIYKIHLNIKPFKCSLCEKSFCKKSNLTEHAKFVHSKNPSVICHHCGANFSCNKTLVHHLKLHSNEKPFECDVCSMKFVTSGRRREHILRKHYPKSENCNICDKKFSLKWELNSHIKKYHS